MNSGKKFNDVKPRHVREILEKIGNSDDSQVVIDLERSHGCFLYDPLGDREILDLFSFFATKAIGHNHPKMNGDAEFIRDLVSVSVENPTNSDFYTVQYANFIETFTRIAMPQPFRHAFFISGGTLAVENALKVAMDWKVKKNFAKGSKTQKGGQVIHFRQAFHGRSGYTMSLTNSKPVQTDYFTQFKWPRIDNPKIKFSLDEASLEKVVQDEARAKEQILQAISGQGDDICAIIIEPIQSEGGDNHFRKEFFEILRKICDENEILLIFDEVQNGVGLTGKFWAYQHFGVTPDILSFGKKMQTCGIIATGRIDEVEDNCFAVKGRLNSTWGGNLGDMVRATKILRIIVEDHLVENSAKQGRYLLAGLEKLGLDNARGRGLQCAFDLPTPEKRDALIRIALKNGLTLGGAGDRSIRFRPNLIIEPAHIDEGMRILEKSLSEI